MSRNISIVRAGQREPAPAARRHQGTGLAGLGVRRRQDRQRPHGRPGHRGGGQGARRAGRPSTSTCPSTTSGCTAIPLYYDGERIGTIVAGLSMALHTPHAERDPAGYRRLHGRAADHRGLRRPLGAQRGLPAGVEDDRRGRGLEHRGPRPALRDGRAARRTHPTGPHPRRHARPSGGQPAPGAALLGRGVAPAAHAGGQDQGRGGTGPAA